MSEVIQKMGFGSINDEDDSLKGKTGGGVFGLNHKVFFTAIEYNANAGKDGEPGDAVDINIMVGDREFRRRIYDVTRVYDSKGNEIPESNDPAYIKEYNSNLAQAMGVVIHALKAVGVVQAQIDAALAVQVPNFAAWANIVTSLKPADFTKRPVDLFLEYQWNIGADQNRTFLEIPKNMKGGRFLAPSINPVGGEWIIENEWTVNNEDGTVENVKGLRYIDAAKNVHTFTRSENYMTSNKAIQQIEGGSANAVAGISHTGSATAAPTGAPKANW